MPSNAVDPTRIGRVVGYDLQSADFTLPSGNLPQRIILLGEANDDKQSGLQTTQQEITTEQEAGELFGFGSTLHMMARILKPKFTSGVGGIPVICIPQLEAPGATPFLGSVDVTGTATANVTHNLVVCGRESIDGVSYSVDIVVGDGALEVAQKISAAIINNVASPLKVLSTTTTVDYSSKWNGASAAGITVTMNTNGNDAGMSYAFNVGAAASGQPDISDALDTFENQWNTLIVNSYGTNADVVNKLQVFNGIPKTPTNPTPTGQFRPTIQKPFIAITGTVEEDETTFTNANKNDVTIALAPAPGSAGLALEAAANMCALYAPVAQATPHLGVGGKTYPDMPTTSFLGDMSKYEVRDSYVKQGFSTVTLSAGKYQVEDFVTTYHPDGVAIPNHRYVRNRTVDSNIRYAYYLLEIAEVWDKAIAGDNDTINVTGVIKPKEWKALVFELLDNLELRALITNSDFSKESLIVNIGETNPNRFETTFDYKRTAIARILSTTVRAGFNTAT